MLSTNLSSVMNSLEPDLVDFFGDSVKSILILVGGLGIGLPPIINFGSDYLKDKVIPDCLAGKKSTERLTQTFV